MVNIKYIIWALLAGAFIPLIGILNGRVGRALGEPFYATVMLFGVAIILALFLAKLPLRSKTCKPCGRWITRLALSLLFM
jgi:transporter family-2 protein